MIGEIRQNFTEVSASFGLILATALKILLSFLDSSLRYILIAELLHARGRNPTFASIRTLTTYSWQLKSNLQSSDFRCASLAVPDSFGVFGVGSMRLRFQTYW